MSNWKSRSYFGGKSGTNDDQDGYGGGQQYEATDGNKRAPSRLKKSSKLREDADDDCPNYTVHNNGSQDDADTDNSYSRNGGNTYNGSVVGTPYYGGGGGYGYNSPYGNGGEGYVPYNAPPAFFVPQDGTRSPMIIQTREVNMYGAPGSQYDNENYSDQRRRGGSGGGGRGFFGPAFHAVGHFFDRKFGLHDRD